MNNQSIQPSYGGRKVVYPSGLVNAPIYIVGKCPMKEEVAQGKNMVGSDGLMLFRQLERAGIRREDCRISNVVWVMPPVKDNIESINKLGVDRSVFTQALMDDINAYPRKVILAVGGEAMLLLTGKNRVTKWRGSILPLLGDPSTPVIPTILPSFIRKGNWPLLLALRSDCKKLHLLANGVDRRIHREFVNYSRGATFSEFMDELERLASTSGFLAYDIEGWHPFMTCISFSDNPAWAMSVPLNGVFRREEEILLLEMIKKVLENPRTGKVAHNMLYDNPILRSYGVGVRNIFMDTMLAHHSVFQDLPHSLEFVTSIYTWENYYKDDRTMVDLVGTQVEADDYSCMDSAVTLEVVEPLLRELVTYGQERFLFDIIMERVKSASEMQIQGMPVNESNRKELKEEKEKELKEAEKMVERFAGVNPHSATQVIKFLYTDLELPKIYRKRKTKGGTKRTLTGDDEAVKTCIQRAPTHSEVLFSILEARQRRMELSTYINSEVGENGRFYFSVNIGPRAMRGGYKGGTPSGRFSIGKLLDGSGIPAQGIPKELRCMIALTEEDCIIWECDLEQAEARVVAWVAGEDFLVDLFMEGKDIHKVTGVLMHPLLFGERLEYEQVVGKMRDFYKMLRHALNYQMGPGQLKVEVVQEFPDFPFTFKLAKRAIAVYKEVHPKTTAWGEGLKESLRKGNRILRTPLGRMRYLLGWNDDDLVRSAISFLPQAVVADTSIEAMRGSQRRFRKEGLNPKKNFIFMQGHDSNVGQGERKEVGRIATILKEENEKPTGLVYKGVPLIIPAKFRVGRNWRDMEEVR